MDILTAIHSRRSVRQFLQTPVPAEKIHVLLEAAMIAPSAGNSQPWQFVVITSRDLLDRIPAIHPYAGMAKTAPLAILVCGDLNAEKYAGFWVQDCSAAMQNLLLAAVAENLGAVWTGIYPDQERVENFKKLFALPKYIIPLGLAIIGFTEIEQKSKSRFAKEKVHSNLWEQS